MGSEPARTAVAFPTVAVRRASEWSAGSTGPGDAAPMTRDGDVISDLRLPATNDGVYARSRRAGGRLGVALAPVRRHRDLVLFVAGVVDLSPRR